MGHIIVTVKVPNQDSYELGNVAQKEEVKKCMQHFYVETPWKIPSWKTEEGLEDDIKMDFMEVVWEDVKWAGTFHNHD
jgi:hypothetical protein